MSEITQVLAENFLDEETMATIHYRVEPQSVALP